MHDNVRTCPRRLLVRMPSLMIASTILLVLADVRGDNADDEGFVRRQPVMEVTDQFIEERILLNRRGGGTLRQTLEQELTLEIRAIDNRCTLTENQRKTLRLAGQGDITRFFRQLEEVRAKFSGTAITAQEYLDLASALKPLQMTVTRGLLSDTSMFRKSMRRTLSSRQREQFQTLEESRQLTAVEEALIFVAQGSDFRLTEEQSRNVITLLLKEARPPKYPSTYSSYVVLIHARKLQDSLQQLMDENQWNVFQAKISAASRLEPMLNQMGLLSDITIAKADLPDGNGKVN